MTYHSYRDTSTAARGHQKLKSFALSSTFGAEDNRLLLTPIDFLNRFKSGKPTRGNYRWRTPQHYVSRYRATTFLNEQIKHGRENEFSVLGSGLNLDLAPEVEKFSFFGREDATLGQRLTNYLRALDGLPEFDDTDVIQSSRVLLYTLGIILGIQRLPLPQVAPSEDNSLAFSWQTDKHQLGIYVYPNRKFDWLWRSPVSKNYEGEEDVDLNVRAPDVPSKLVSRLRNVFSDR